MAQHRINTAVILAAGMGNRLKPFTDNRPKCMVHVAGKPLLAHTFDALEASGFERVVLVTGYMSEMLTTFSKEYSTSLHIEYVHNENYDVTNNIYSLWLASDKLSEGFTLIESDIVLEPHILESFTLPDKIALDIFDESKHSGTRARVCSEGNLEKLYVKQPHPASADEIYKTVNIYSFSAESGGKLFRDIYRIIKKGDVNSFYEIAIRDLVAGNEINLEMVDFNSVWWDEIDTPDDLERVESYLSDKTKTFSGEELSREK